MEWVALAVLWLLERVAGGAVSDIGKGLLERLVGLTRDVARQREALERDADRASAALDENAVVIGELIEELAALDAENTSLRGRVAALEIESAEARRLRDGNAALRRQNAVLRADLLRLRQAAPDACA